MARCSLCKATATAEARYCPTCGAMVEQSTTRTQVVTGPPPSPTPLEDASTSFTGVTRPVTTGGAARCLPGTVRAERYRIVALLGRGGMGEVYRADDLILGEPVALKFLPEGLSQDAERRARLRAEVKLARAVGHPSVC